MRRLLISLLLLVACATPAAAQQAIVAKYRAHYGTPLTAAEQLAIVRAVAAELHAGILRKPDGNNCSGYACDIVCRSTTEVYDVLGDAENRGIPQWNPTTNPRGYACEMVPAVPQPPDNPPDNPPVPPVPPVTSGGATEELQKAEVAALIEIVHQLQIQNAALTAAVQDLKNTIAAGVRIRF